MHPKSFLAGALMVGSIASAHGPDAPPKTSLVARHGPSGPTPTSSRLAPRHGPDGDGKPSILPRHGPDGDDKHSILPRHGPDGDDKQSLLQREIGGSYGGTTATKIIPREAHGPTKLVERAPVDAATTPAPTTTSSSYDPSKVSKFRSDMHNLHTKIRADPLYTSMARVLKTAVPNSYREGLVTNPTSVHAQYTTAPDWYQKLPSDIRSFMERNQKSAKSIWEKDMGPLPTGKNGKNGEKKADSTVKSEAAGLSLIGASVFALVGAFGIAALLL